MEQPQNESTQKEPEKSPEDLKKELQKEDQPTKVSYTIESNEEAKTVNCKGINFYNWFGRRLSLVLKGKKGRTMLRVFYTSYSRLLGR